MLTGRPLAIAEIVVPILFIGSLIVGTIVSHDTAIHWLIRDEDIALSRLILAGLLALLPIALCCICIVVNAKSQRFSLNTRILIAQLSGSLMVIPLAPYVVTVASSAALG